MNREIKFRAWNPDDNRMEYPLVFATCNDGVFKPLISCVDGNRAYKDYPIMQSTGLKDKNGKDVYEGDIISSKQWNPREYKVIFEDGEFCFVSIKGVEKPYTNPIHYVENFSVIGNIYENPELLSERSQGC
jgi:uncharacterized phage protein (TIGR01671 family)